MSAITKSQIYIRHKTIDSCLKDANHKWSLNDMILQCNKVLSKEYKTKVSVSLRTIQADIEYLRYNISPIEVYERKYYRYSQAQRSMESPLGPADKEQPSAITNDIAATPSVNSIVEQMRKLAKISPEYNWLEPFAFQIENHIETKPVNAETPRKISKKIMEVEPDLFSQPDEPEMFTLF